MDDKLHWLFYLCLKTVRYLQYFFFRLNLLFLGVCEWVNERPLSRCYKTLYQCRSFHLLLIHYYFPLMMDCSPHHETHSLADTTNLSELTMFILLSET